MIHTNRFVTVGREKIVGIEQHTESFARRRKVLRIYCSLMLEARRQMSITETGEAVRLERFHSFKCRQPACPRLKRQAVNQIDVDACKTRRASTLDELAHLLIGIDSLDSLLNIFIEILKSRRNPAKTTFR